MDQDTSAFNHSSEKKISLLAIRNNELRQNMRLKDPGILAANTGAIYNEKSPDSGEFHLPLWQDDVIVDYPEFSISFRNRTQEPGIAQQALILYYFHTADGALLENRWVSFADLPDGRFYNQAFQGYTGNELARFFNNDSDLFNKACIKASGSHVSIGDVAFSFLPLPKVCMLALMWQGDEDFPSNFQVLFDASTSHYLPIDVSAIAGSMLTRLLIKSAQP